MLHRCVLYALNRRHFSSRPAGAVVSFGDGCQGALGVDQLQDEYEPEVVDIEQPIHSIGAGHFHSLAVTHDGSLWTWGRGAEGQLGRVTEIPTEDPKPGRVTSLEDKEVASATGSGVASFACTTKGDVFSWGTSKRGQLGLTHNVISAQSPQRVPSLSCIQQVSAGWGHTLALNDDGEVLSWGFPQHGRLGHTFASSAAQEEEGLVLERCVWKPQKVEALSGVPIKQVACGFDFSLALASNGSLFSFGDNSLGQLGRSTEGQNSPDPSEWLVKDPSGKPYLLEKVSAGISHCIAITKGGDLVAWGWNSGGQMGLGDVCLDATFPFPRQVKDQMLQEPRQIGAGRVHSIVGTAGSVQSCGSGRNGRLGHGSQLSCSTFTEIEALDSGQLLQVACGLDHTLLLVGGLV